MVDLIVDEGLSAKTMKREGFQRIVRMIQAGEIDAVIVCKLDRLTRSVRDLADILDLFGKHHVALVSLAESLDTESASGKLVMNIMVAVSQWEREAIGERTRAVLDYKRKKGERLGNIPYGMKDDGNGKLVQNDLEQRILTEAWTCRNTLATDTWTADYLNKRGYLTRNGSLWRREYVARILKSA